MRLRLMRMVALACSATAATAHAAPGLSVRITPRDAGLVGDAGDEEGVFRQGRPMRAFFTITNLGEEPHKYAPRVFARGEGLPEYDLEVRDAQDHQFAGPLC